MHELWVPLAVDTEAPTDALSYVDHRNLIDISPGRRRSRWRLLLGGRLVRWRPTLRAQRLRFEIVPRLWGRLCLVVCRWLCHRLRFQGGCRPARWERGQASSAVRHGLL